MEEKYYPVEEENFFAVQLVLRTKTKLGERTPCLAPDLFVQELVDDFLHPDNHGRDYVIKQSSIGVFFPQERGTVFPLKVVQSFHEDGTIEFDQLCNPVHYQNDEDGYAFPLKKESDNA